MAMAFDQGPCATGGHHRLPFGEVWLLASAKAPIVNPRCVANEVAASRSSLGIL